CRQLRRRAALPQKLPAHLPVRLQELPAVAVWVEKPSSACERAFGRRVSCVSCPCCAMLRGPSSAWLSLRLCVASPLCSSPFLRFDQKKKNDLEGRVPSRSSVASC